ncbi:hypothetical protein M9H77_09185 [Catharanthus roseus]|uniref:Uncharacterized protein n=1 Tax=Catharanthus roseus TaxID=4058 RepID=A0ACC0C003_CATRO|nr:hypothetical protein M9H77_09185 [Catharanthus roseus]
MLQQWESSQWFSNARYDYTHSGAFLDIGSGSPVNDLVESDTVRLLDWNDSMTDIQLRMRFVDKVQAISAVLCRENGSRTNTYVLEIYSRQMYGRTYQANFYPILSENCWRDVPFNLTFYPPNMKKERGRKHGKRFQGKKEYRNPDSPPRCSRCYMPGHNRKNYNNPGPSNV